MGFAEKSDVVIGREGVFVKHRQSLGLDRVLYGIKVGRFK